MVHWKLALSNWLLILGVYLLIRKGAVLRYIWRLLAAYVYLLANMAVF